MPEFLSCPCGSAKAYDTCCGPFHGGNSPAPSAEQLMRSRYSAFALRDIAYLLATTHSNLLPTTSFPALQAFAQSSSFRQLEVLETKAGGPQDPLGEVEFRAWYIRAGHLECIWERSRFERENGHWKYHSGTQKKPPRIGRNDPCPCGSGKKYKKCHG